MQDKHYRYYREMGICVRCYRRPAEIGVRCAPCREVQNASMYNRARILRMRDENSGRSNRGMSNGFMEPAATEVRREIRTTHDYLDSVYRQLGERLRRLV